MTSEQNAPEVESHQGSTMSPAQQDGEAQSIPHNVQHGMGQSKSSRRRRRKRKNKGVDAQPGAQPGGDQNAGQPIPSIQGSAAASPSQQQNFQPSGGQQQNGSGGGKRWKKKFRDRDRQRSPDNPGNVASGSNGSGYSNNGGGYRDRDTHQPGNSSGGFRRKGGKQQQRGPRSFVGPMDHSYRAVNGNFADTPPSTIDAGNYGRSNGHHGGGRSYQSDSQPIDYSHGRPIPIPEK